MKPNRYMSVDQVAALFNDVMPLISDQHVVFSQIVDSVAYCTSLGSSAWSITVSDRGLRMNVGAVEALTWSFTPSLENDSAANISNIRVFLAGGDCLGKIDDADEVGTIEEMAYKPIGAPHWVYSGGFLIASDSVPDPTCATVIEQIDCLRSNHHQYLKRACTTSTGRLRKTSNFSQHNCEAIYQYALRVVDKGNSDSPDKERSQEQVFDQAVLNSMKDDSAKRRARLDSAPIIPERVPTLSMAFRRNPDVVAEVLLRASGRCESCKQPAPFLRASNGTPYLEVHHTIQLAAGGHDTVENAVAFCPNCHRAAHLA